MITAVTLAVAILAVLSLAWIVTATFYTATL